MGSSLCNGFTDVSDARTIPLTCRMTDWVSFLVLDIGTPVIQAIPIGRRIAAAFIQSAAVRAAGFAIVPLNSLAPAVK